MLDEPTNHLDIDSREILEEVLEEFEGPYCSYPMTGTSSQACKQDREIKDGKIRYYEGNYNYYRERKEKRISTLTRLPPIFAIRLRKPKGEGKIE